jgi:PAS domain S-box-containing protein
MNEGLGMQDENDIVTYVNEKFCNMLGYSSDEMIGRFSYDFLDEADALVVKKQIAVRKTGEKKTYESRWMRKDGQKINLLVSPQPLVDESGGYKGSFAIFTDITERKRNEKLIRLYRDRLSRLTSRLALVEEKEKRKIAMDLHDNIGQILAYVHMMLRDLQRSAQGALGNSLEQIRSLIEESIKYTRSLIFQLSAPLLYEIGLEAAVEWLGQEIQRKHGIEFRLREDGTAKPLQEEMRVILFQSIRELLTNVVRHARARSVTVTVERKGSSIRVVVEDDGIGFDVRSVYDGHSMEGGFGLFSVRERLKNIGGLVDIESAPGASTRITLTAPLEDGREKGEEK